MTEPRGTARSRDERHKKLVKAGKDNDHNVGGHPQLNLPLAFVIKSDSAPFLMLLGNAMPNSRAKLFCLSVAGSSRQLPSSRLCSLAKGDALFLLFGRNLMPNIRNSSPIPPTMKMGGDTRPSTTPKHTAPTIKTSPETSKGKPTTRRNKLASNRMIRPTRRLSALNPNYRILSIARTHLSPSPLVCGCQYHYIEKP
jgi:hypothetical protein